MFKQLWELIWDFVKDTWPIWLAWIALWGLAGLVYSLWRGI